MSKYDFSKRTAAEEPPERERGGNFRPFVPEIKWKEDKEKRYILFLTPLGSCPTVEYHDWIPVGKGTKADGEEYLKYEQFIARTDPVIGEEYDDLADRLGRNPKSRSIGVAVELEPVEETVKGRTKPVSFTVATDTYERKTDDGGSETITTPVMGLVVQADPNFWSWLRSYNATEGDIEETPMQVIRDGKDANTTYNFFAYPSLSVDLSNLVDLIDGVSYFGENIDGLLAELDGKDETEAGLTIGQTLLDLRLDELADPERYSELVDPIEEIEDRFGNNKKTTKTPPKVNRPQRQSSRAKETTSEAPSKAEKFKKLRDQVEA